MKMWDYVNLPYISTLGFISFLKKFPFLKNSALSSRFFFKNHFNLIKTVCKSNAKLFSYKNICINGFMNHYFLNFFHSLNFCFSCFFLRVFHHCEDFSFALRLFLEPYKKALVGFVACA